MVIKLLEVTCGQWMYSNIHDRDAVSRLKVLERIEELQGEIEHQIMLGGAGLNKQDRYQLEINAGDLDISSGEDD